MDGVCPSDDFERSRWDTYDDLVMRTGRHPRGDHSLRRSIGSRDDLIVVDDPPNLGLPEGFTDWFA